MKIASHRLAYRLLFPLLLTTVRLSTAWAVELDANLQPESGILEWHFKGQKLLTYAFATNQFKPYVRELRTLGGHDVLRDAPADHLHHHGLMYAIRVNGVNFWEERDQPGWQRSVKLTHKTGKTVAGLPQACLTHVIHWVAHTNAHVADSASAALLIEKRVLTLTVDEAAKEVALNWHAEFEAGCEQVKLHGSAYNGLGLRLPAAWDHVAKHMNSEHRGYTDKQEWDVIPARWAAVSYRNTAQAGNRGDKVTIALFGSPSNSGETRFFSMLNPFTYLAVTQNLEKEPLEYQRGQKWRIDYLLVAYDSNPGGSALEKRYRSR